MCVRFQFVHKIVYYIVVNLPFFVIRLVIWHLHDKHISVFLVKNVLGMGLAVQHLHEVAQEVSEVMKSDTRPGSAATAAEPGSIEMRKLTIDAGAENDKSAETSEMAEIQSQRV